MQLINPSQTSFDEIYRLFHWEIPQQLNIAHQVCERHQSEPDHIAVYYESADGTQFRYSFGQLKILSDQFANVLKAQGIKPGDRVAIVLSQSIETVVAHLAIYKLGAIALPLAVLFGPEALEYRLRDSAALIAITDQAKYQTLCELQPELEHLQLVIGCRTGDTNTEFWHLLESATSQFEIVNTLADDPAMLIYTSGTTGPPKGALIAHRAVIGNFTGFELSQNFFPNNNDLFWTPADWAWTGGLWDALL
ncbi:MAG: AMP-binding protein, partial [Gammaproteobacteria bacterium]|nr:AMP-binding protein [Gammaproteobacteria bacterium]